MAEAKAQYIVVTVYKDEDMFRTETFSSSFLDRAEAFANEESRWEKTVIASVIDVVDNKVISTYQE